MCNLPFWICATLRETSPIICRRNFSALFRSSHSVARKGRLSCSKKWNHLYWHIKQQQFFNSLLFLFSSVNIIDFNHTTAYFITTWICLRHLSWAIFQTTLCNATSNHTSTHRRTQCTVTKNAINMLSVEIFRSFQILINNFCWINIPTVKW